MTRRRLLLLVSAVVVVAGSITTAVIVEDSGSDARAADADSPVMVAPSTTEAPPTTRARQPVVTTTTAPLPVPEAPPADPYADVPVFQIGTVEIPKIGLVHPVYEGITLTVIDEGPGHWPGTAMPGKRGNTVFAGHRVTHSHPFYDLDLLAPGDEVTLHMPDGDFTYAVTETLIVVPSDIWVVDQTEEPTMTLSACHPKHSAQQRIVVKGRLVRSVPSMASVAIALQAGEAIEAVG